MQIYVCIDSLATHTHTHTHTQTYTHMCVYIYIGLLISKYGVSPVRCQRSFCIGESIVNTVGKSIGLGIYY